MEAEKTYTGEITNVEYTESQKGTTGLRFELALAEFEVDVKSAAFWESPKSYLVGKGCSVVTELKDNKVQIKWFNGPKRAGRVASPGAAAKAMRLFGAEVPFA